MSDKKLTKKQLKEKAEKLALKNSRANVTVPGSHKLRRSELLAGDRKPATTAEKLLVDGPETVEESGDGVFEVDESVTISDEEAEATLEGEEEKAE